MVYITLLDQFHPGIYKSQVIDVCKYLSKLSDRPVRLFAFLSIREILSTDHAKKIRELYPHATVLPAFPGLANYRLSALLLMLMCLLKSERKIIARNAFAATIALTAKRFGFAKRVIIDVRSSLTAEIHEYNSFPIPKLKAEIKETEQQAILKSDFRMAVSNEMLNHWRKTYAYNSENYVVIPCTLNRAVFSEHQISEKNIENKRAELGFQKDDVILIFSGSNAPWQGEQLKQQVIAHYMAKPKHHIVFLSKMTPMISSLITQYPNRISQQWLKHEEVLDFLQIADYGMILREQTVTNKVASPVKFAEYLTAGLKVLISEDLGDFSKMVHEHHLGHVISLKKELPGLVNTPLKEKEALFEFAQEHFQKRNYRDQYTRLIEI